MTRASKKHIWRNYINKQVFVGLCSETNVREYFKLKKGIFNNFKLFKMLKKSFSHRHKTKFLTPSAFYRCI